MTNDVAQQSSRQGAPNNGSAFAYSVVFTGAGERSAFEVFMTQGSRDVRDIRSDLISAVLKLEEAS